MILKRVLNAKMIFICITTNAKTVLIVLKGIIPMMIVALVRHVKKQFLIVHLAKVLIYV